MYYFHSIYAETILSSPYPTLRRSSHRFRSRRVFSLRAWKRALITPAVNVLNGLAMCVCMRELALTLRHNEKRFSYRGLTLVCADEPSNGVESTRPRSDSTTSASTFSSTSTSSSVNSSTSSNCLASTSQLPTAAATIAPHSLLISSFPYSAILAPLSTPTRSTFLPSSSKASSSTFNLPPARSFARGVNLRHFGLQPAKYATVCDIVVYGKDGLCDHVVAITTRIREAQMAIKSEREKNGTANGVEYNVFVVSGASLLLSMHSLSKVID